MRIWAWRMTKRVMHNLCTLHAQTMRMVCAVFLMAGVAQAGAWEEFETRCLGPMENVALAHPADHKQHKSFKNDGGTYTTYRIDGATLAVSDGRMDQAQWCLVQVRGAEAPVFMDAGLAWSALAQKSGRYEKIEDRVMGFVLRSTEWREPKIDVSMTMAMKGGQFTLRVLETDLES